MARPLRLDFPGAVHHVTARGNAQAAIFVDDVDRQTLLRTLQDVITQRHWLCHGYCLMDNHYHLLIETPDADLSVGMRQLNGVYTQRFNRRHHRVGHLYQGRFKAILVERDSHLLELCRYVVLNPVRARITKDPARYPWSSYPATMGLVSKPGWLSVDWILSQFGRDRAKARRQYADFVAAGVQAPSPWASLRGQVVLGSAAFVESMRPAQDDNAGSREIPRVQRLAPRLALDELLPSSMRTEKKSRDEAIKRAYREFGYSLADIARAVGIHYSTVSRVVKGER
jgi:REP element-mobilizing transposase RayT